MKHFFYEVGAFLRKTWVWTLLCVFLLALMVWFVGPLLAVDDFRFWETAAARLFSISVMFLAWGLGVVFANWRAGLRKSASEESDDGQERRRREDQRACERTDLTRRFKQALLTLKTSNVYRGRSNRWRSDLPWYLLIGQQGSGKTSLLSFSGLEFPLNKHDPVLSDDARSHSSCDWYFAEYGVLIDAPGRYMSQPDVEVDQHGWRTLLRLLRQRRRNRPLNGVIVTVSADQLISPDQKVLESLFSQLKGRLQDIQQRLHVNLPVYLVVSMADRLLGFDEFFDQLSLEENDQVLGASFDKDRPGAQGIVLREEFEALLQRLNSQVILRMQQESETLRRGRILDFPYQLGRIGGGLSLLVESAFAGNRYQRLSQLRGFYVTSAPPPQSLNRSENASQTRGRARFINHLFSRVIFPEANLAVLDKRECKRLRWQQRAMFAGALLVLGIVGAHWVEGFAANHERLERVRQLAQQWTQARVAALGDDEVLAALEAMDLRYEATQVFLPVAAVSLYERAGFYQGASSNPVLKAAYDLELELQFLPRIARALEGQIRGNAKDREHLLNSLRAYLMLNLEARRDSAWLQEWLASEWSRRYPGNGAVQDRLNAHLGRLLQRPFSYRLNDALVAQTRQALRGESLASVVYRALREQTRHLPEYRLNKHLGPQASVFQYADYLIPGLYTQQGYQQYFTQQGVGLVTEILQDNWVLGEANALSGMDFRRLRVELEQLYFRDYANYWGEAVGRVRLSTINDASEAGELLASLTSANSPMIQLLLEIRENTRFQSAPEESAQAMDALADKGITLGKVATVVAGKAQDILAKKLPDAARKSLQSRFEPLHRLLDESNGPSADLLPSLQALNELELQMASLGRSSQPEQAAFEMAKLRMGGQRDALSQLRTAAIRLPRPVGAWFDVVAQDAWKMVLGDAYRYLNQRYQSEIYGFYDKALHRRFPFNAHSSSDVALSDFREFFKAQGVAERFFENYMRPFVTDDEAHYRLRSIDGYSLPMSRLYLEQMSTMQHIRRSFFAENSSEPQVRFKLEPYTLDPSVSRSEFRFGSQQIEYRHGPILPVAFQWPTDEADGRTSLVLEKMVGRPIGIEKNTGPWSLFRLLDLMQTEYLTGRDVMVLKADLGGLHANYLLTSQRTPNPFDMSVLRTFRLPAQL